MEPVDPSIVLPTHSESSLSVLDPVSIETLVNYSISLSSPTIPAPTSTRDESLAIAEIATLAVIFLLALSSNVFMLVAIWRQRQYRPLSRMYFFMLHLSLADVLVAIFNILPQLLWDITYRFLGGDLLCRFVKYSQIMPLYLSTYLLMFMALDRYRAVCSASNNLHWNSLKVAKMMVATAWLLSMLLAIPQAVIFGEQYINPDGVSTETDCWVRFIEPWGAKAYVTWFVISIFALPLVVIGFSYGAISHRLWRYSQEARRSEKAHMSIATHQRIMGVSAGSTSSWPTSQRWRRTSRVLNRLCISRPKRSNHKRNSCGDFEEGLQPATGHVLEDSQSSSSSSKPAAESLPLRESDTSSTSKSSRNKIKIEPFPLRRSNSNRITRAKIKTIQLTLLVVICFVVCWAPFCITQLILVYDPPTNLANVSPIAVILLLLASLNSCTNPWIYLAFSGSLVNQMRVCLGMGLGRSRSSDNDSIGDDERHKHEARAPMAGRPARFSQGYRQQRHNRPLLHVHTPVPLRVNKGRYVGPGIPAAMKTEGVEGGRLHREGFRRSPAITLPDRDPDRISSRNQHPRTRSERSS